jgi:hypothetical protein
VATLDIPVRNPEDILAKAEGGGVVPFTIDLPTDDAEFLERYAVHRNKVGELELAAKNDKKAKPGQRWSRKTLSEYLLRGQIDLLREQVASMEKALGPIPEDEEAAAKYAQRAFEWKKKKSA